MPGSVRRRPERGPNAYELRIYLGRDHNGAVRHQSRIFRGTKREAERELARLMVDLEAAPVGVESDRRWGPSTTVNDAIEGWKENGWEDLSPLTVRRYENVWKVHIRSTIGRRRISSLNAYDIERFFRDMKRQGAGRETVRYVRSILNRSCRLARKWRGNTLHNPVAESEIPNYATRSEPVRAPSVEELVAVLEASKQLDVRYAVCLRFVAATGVRRGEACALRWSDIDWESSTVVIDEAAIPAPGGAIIKAPKNRAGTRLIALDDGTLGEIRRLRVEQELLAITCEEELSEESFVFSADPGGTVPPYPDTVSRAFKQARDIAELPTDLHLHSLRHFQATVLDAVISERQKQARLGWSTVHMARHYTDVVSSEGKRAAEYVGRILDTNT